MGSGKKTVLLTGGSGFIGRNIQDSFLAEQYTIIAPSHRDLDLADERVVDRFFIENNIDFVIHGATKPGHRNASDTEKLFYTNTRLFLNLYRNRDKYKKMMVLGSGAVYDLRYYTDKMKEDDYLTHLPADDHGFCKYVCDQIMENADNIVDLRIFGIYGKYEDYAIRFISNMICKAMYDLPLTMHQNRSFDYLYVSDLMNILNHFMQNDTMYSNYNVTPDNAVELKELAAMVLSVMGKSLPIEIAKEGMGLPYSGDNTRLRKELPMFEFTPHRIAIEELVAYYEKNKSQINKEFLLVDK